MALEAGWGQLGRGLGDISQSMSRDASGPFGLELFWEGFGKPLGVARGSKNLAFSFEGCSKSDFELDV